jgi:DNA polymerase-3 subunit delta'
MKTKAAQNDAAEKSTSTAVSGHRPEAQGLAGVAGQDAVVATLRGAIAAGRPHHAYLFDGPEGVGKATCARALFAGLNCLSPPAPGDACGSCASCSKLLSGNHPDLIRFDMTLAGLADEAERLIRRLAFSPHEGRVQMVIFDPADNFSAPTALTAANRLLKTLEEPVERTHFVLVTSAAQGLLITLRSRTQRLRFSPLADAVLRDELVRHHGIAQDEAGSVVKLAQGSLGRALRQLGDTEAMKRREEAAGRLFEAAQNGRAQEIVELAADVGSDRDEIQEVLELLWLKLHGELRPALQKGPRERDRLIAGLRLVRETSEAIRRYTSPPLSLERMMRRLGPVAGTREGRP